MRLRWDALLIGGAPLTDESEKSVSDRERWLTETNFREREIENEVRSIDLKEQDLQFRRSKLSKSPWRSPIVVAVFAATLAALGNAVVATVNGYTGRQIEAEKAEQSRILEMIKTGDPDTAATNLVFLLDSGLIENERIASKLRTFLDQRTPGTGPALASAAPSQRGIVGIDDAKPVEDFRDRHQAKRMARSVGRLLIGRDGGQARACTAFLVKRDLIVTARFCQGDPNTRLRLQLSPQGSSGEIVELDVRLPAVSVTSNGTDQGLAFFRLEKDVGRQFEPLTVSQNAPIEGAPLGIIYFRGGSQQMAIWDNRDCRITELSDEELHHSCDTGFGTSGSPVVDISTNSVVGVHYRRNYNPDGGVAYRLDETTVP